MLAQPPIAHPSRALPLSGTVIGIDPGHNGRNWSDPSFINHLVWNGREMETCDTTGTETDGGYTEAQFNWNVASHLRADLTADGAKVVLTRHNNDSVGPCVNTRARIIDRAHASVAIDIHLAGLNLTTVPKVLIECGNMRNATDARILVTASFQKRAAAAIAAAMIKSLGR